MAVFLDLLFVACCRIIAGMIVFHLLMTGVLSLKESYYTSVAMLPLPVITILFFFFIQQHFLRPSMYLSLNMASGLAEASPHFLQVRRISWSSGVVLSCLVVTCTDRHVVLYDQFVRVELSPAYAYSCQICTCDFYCAF